MTTISQDIRGALQTTAEAVAGFPPAGQRDYDGGPQFSPTPNVPWVRMQFVPTARRRIGLKLSQAKDHQGIFNILLAGPPQQGSAPIEQLADRIVDAFSVDQPIILGGARVQIVAAERKPTMDGPGDIQCPVVVSWRCLTAS